MKGLRSCLKVIFSLLLRLSKKLPIRTTAVFNKPIERKRYKGEVKVMKTFTPMVNIGSLMVYESHPMNDELGVGLQFWWVDERDGHHYGPFFSVYEATQHYSTIIQVFNSNTGAVGMQKPHTAQVIRVDFKCKRRKHEGEL